MSDRTYYRAAGASLDAVRAFLTERESSYALRQKLTDDLGGEMWSRGESVLGVSYRGSPPAAFAAALRKTIVEGIEMWVPERREEPGRRLDARFRAATLPGTQVLTQRLFGERSLGAQCRFRYVGWHSFDEDTLVIVMPEGTDLVPPDAIRMKRSEYWALVEAESETGGASTVQRAPEDGGRPTVPPTPRG